MGRAVNYVKGSVRLEVTGPYPERFLNICGASNVQFRSIQRVDETCLRLVVPLRQAKLAETLAPKCMCEVKRLSESGAPSFVRQMVSRWGMVAGMALSIGAVLLLSRFVMVIDVTGNETVPDSVILSELKESGMYPGVYGPAVDERKISNRMLMELEELSFLSVNIRGVRAEIVVREAQQPPELEPVGQAIDLVAEKAGTIWTVLPQAGHPVVEEEMEVQAGDVLISGTVPVEKMPDLPVTETYPVAAKGEVWAEVTEVCQVTTPLSAIGKEYTGQERTEYELRLMGKGFKISPKAFQPFTYYDKIEKTWSISISEGEKLPFGWVRRTCREYRPVAVRVRPESAEQYLKTLLEGQLRQRIGENGAVLEQQWSTETNDGALTVTLTARCREQIARRAEVPQQEGN